MREDESDGRSRTNEKWDQFAEAVNVLASRIADPDDFEVSPGSSLAGDDQRSHPFVLSQAIRHLINASVDQLHGIKVLQVHGGIQHLAVDATLARAALENSATALWILGPRTRDERLERLLRWHVRNYQDERTTMGNVVADRTNRHIEQIIEVARGRGLSSDKVRSGYKLTAPIKGSQEFTAIEVKHFWSIASGLAHGRPWAFQGLLNQETISIDKEGDEVRLISPRSRLSLLLPLQALHLLAEVIRLRDRRAGLKMQPLPGGLPDSEPARRPSP